MHIGRVCGVLVVVCAWAVVEGQDAYTQGVLNGATFALAGTAVVGLGVIALKEHQNRQRRNKYRYNPYAGYHGGYQQLYQLQQQQQPYQQLYQQQQYGYYQPGITYGYYRRRRDLSQQQQQQQQEQEVLEQEFAKILAKDKDRCGMRLVCELEARARRKEHIGQYGELILELFGTQPAPQSREARSSAWGQYSRAASVGATAPSVATCQQNYSSCQYSSRLILSLVKAARISRSQ